MFSISDDVGARGVIELTAIIICLGVSPRLFPCPMFRQRDYPRCCFSYPLEPAFGWIGVCGSGRLSGGPLGAVRIVY